MTTIAEIKAAAAARNKAATNSGNAAATLKEQLQAEKPAEIAIESAGTKRYFNKIPSSRFIFSDNVEVFFHYGRLEIGPDNVDYPSMKTMWRAYQKELDAILGSNPSIFVVNNQIEKMPDVKQNALSEAEVAAQDATLKLGSVIKTQQEIGTNANTTGAPSNVNESTVDPAIRAAMLGQITTEGAADRAASQTAGAASSA